MSVGVVESLGSLVGIRRVGRWDKDVARMAAIRRGRDVREGVWLSEWHACDSPNRRFGATHSAKNMTLPLFVFFKSMSIIRCHQLKPTNLLSYWVDGRDGSLFIHYCCTTPSVPLFVSTVRLDFNQFPAIFHFQLISTVGFLFSAS